MGFSASSITKLNMSQTSKISLISFFDPGRPLRWTSSPIHNYCMSLIAPFSGRGDRQFHQRYFCVEWCIYHLGDGCCTHPLPLGSVFSFQVHPQFSTVPTRAIARNSEVLPGNRGRKRYATIGSSR